MLTFKTSSVLVLIALLVVWFFQFPWWIGIAVLLVYTGLLVWGSIRVDSQFYMKAVVKGAGGERRIAISFDDGPLPEYTLSVLDTLAAANQFYPQPYPVWMQQLPPIPAQQDQTGL